MAGDHEIAAIKAAGINVFAVLGPSFVMGAILSLGTFILTDQFIPMGRARIERIVTLAMEDIFLDVLRANNSYNDPTHGISITVSGVRGRTLIRPIFRYRLSSGDVATISALEAAVNFEMREPQVRLTLRHGHCETPQGDNADFEEEEQLLPMPVTTDTLKAPRNMTIDSIRRELSALVREHEEATERQAIKTVLALSEGAFDSLAGPEQQRAEQQDSLRDERHQK